MVSGGRGGGWGFDVWIFLFISFSPFFSFSFVKGRLEMIGARCGRDLLVLLFSEVSQRPVFSTCWIDDGQSISFELLSRPVA